MNRAKEKILELAEKYNIIITFIDKNHDDWDKKNHSWVIGNDEIWLGDYDDEEKMLISFFHELGHCRITQEFIKEWNYNTLIIELECWHIGINLAKKDGIIFSDQSISWGYKQALSYVDNDEREDSSWYNRVRPTLWRYNCGTL